MRGVSQAWPARLLAAAPALALVVACVIGAYAHATGHELPAAEHAAAAVDAGHHVGHHGRRRPSQGISATPTIDGDGVGHSPDCCDTICHGGQAILAAYAPVLLRPYARR